MNENSNSRIKRLAAIGGILISSLYLLNFGLGVIFELPDVLPFIGNIDEFVAATILIASLKHFGIDLTDFLMVGRGSKKDLKK